MSYYSDHGTICDHALFACYYSCDTVAEVVLCAIAIVASATIDCDRDRSPALHYFSIFAPFHHQTPLKPLFHRKIKQNIKVSIFVANLN